MSDLYEADILEWSERQTDLLRRVAAGNRTGTIDWANIIEEVESVGRNELLAVKSLLVEALVHMLKASAWPNAAIAPNWESEARHLRYDAASRFSPSMLQHLDIAKLHARALRILPETIDGQPPLPVPQACAMTLDELLADDTGH
jgi:hypothetical protein